LRQLAEVVKANKFEDVIQVVHRRVEEVQLQEKVDVIVSEWMGFYLLHESMLESVLVDFLRVFLFYTTTFCFLPSCTLHFAHNTVQIFEHRFKT
jgi:hypothetical protein